MKKKKSYRYLDLEVIKYNEHNGHYSIQISNAALAIFINSLINKKLLQLGLLPVKLVEVYRKPNSFTPNKISVCRYLKNFNKDEILNSDIGLEDSRSIKKVIYKTPIYHIFINKPYNQKSNSKLHYFIFTLIKELTDNYNFVVNYNKSRRFKDSGVNVYSFGKLTNIPTEDMIIDKDCDVDSWFKEVLRYEEDYP